MILCVSPNLCYDRVLIVPGFAAGGVHRATRATPLAGGKGLNVARAATALGESVVVVGFIGGAAGEAIARGARQGRLSASRENRAGVRSSSTRGGRKP